METYFYRRAFLNEEPSTYTSVIVGHIRSEGFENSKRQFFNSQLTITGCDSRIDFDVDVEDNEYDSSLHKLTLLQDFITDYRKAFILAREDYLKTKDDGTIL